jgi:hypothetical protein
MINQVISIIKNNLLVFLFITVGIILTIILMFSGALQKELLLVRTNTPQGIKETIYQSNPVVFYFSKEIDPKTIKIKTFPEIKIITKTSLQDGLGSITISPVPWWRYDTDYTITIDRSLSGKGGEKLKNDISFSFTLVFPKSEKDIPEQPGPPPGYPNL